MVVPSRVLDHPTAPEHLDEVLESRPRAGRLRHGELVLDLPARATRRVAYDRDREASLAVDEADGPLLGAWPFLLIDRTGRIVTAHRHIIPEGCDNERVPPDARCFQHLASCTVRDCSRQGQPPAAHGGHYLRQICYSLSRGERAKSFLLGSSCRHEARTVSSPLGRRCLACSL